MPLLFSLAIHDPLEEASRELRPEEHLFAYLDDVCFSGDVPNRTRTVYDSFGEKLFTQAGIRLHSGKTRVWNRASVCLEGMAELGPEVWNPEGVKVLGTPVGSRAFVDEVVGGDTMGSRPPGRVADPHPMCRPEIIIRTLPP